MTYALRLGSLGIWPIPKAENMPWQTRLHLTVKEDYAAGYSMASDTYNTSQRLQPGRAEEDLEAL